MTAPTYSILSISISEAFDDSSFNCRGSITPIDVADLAKSIQANGLQFPISVQPRSDVKTYIPDQFNYRIVAGHRRFMACKVLGWKEVPAFIRTGLDEIQARILNLSENLDRKDLNILQEAHALKSLWEAGLPRDSVARELSKSSSWVQVRYNLLTLPPEIQQEAAAGILNQYQIKQLYSLDTVEEMYDAVKKIKDAKVRGEIVDPVGKRQKRPTSVKKIRMRPEMYEMMDFIVKAIGYGLYTRTIAWCAGEISTAELFQDIKDAADEQGKTIILPTEF